MASTRASILGSCCGAIADCKNPGGAIPKLPLLFPLVEQLFPGSKEVPHHRAHEQNGAGDIKDHIPITSKLDDEARDGWGQNARDRSRSIGQANQNTRVLRSNVQMIDAHPGGKAREGAKAESDTQDSEPGRGSL